MISAVFIWLVGLVDGANMGGARSVVEIYFWGNRKKIQTRKTPAPGRRFRGRGDVKHNTQRKLPTKSAGVYPSGMEHVDALGGGGNSPESALVSTNHFTDASNFRRWHFEVTADFGVGVAWIAPDARRDSLVRWR